MKFSHVIVLLLAVFIVGCAASGAAFKQIQAPDPGNAVVYLMREGGFVGAAYCPNVEANQEKVGCLKMNGYIRIEVPAGENKLCFCKSALEVGNDFEITLSLKEGEIRYFQWVPKVGDFTVVGGNVYATGGDLETVVEHDQQSALKKLRALKRSN